MPTKTPHPGKTKAQRAALDAIGCGDNMPRMAKSTRDALLKSGMIVQCGQRTFGTGWSAVSVPIYEMSISTHMAWCAADHGDDIVEASDV